MAFNKQQQLQRMAESRRRKENILQQEYYDTHTLTEAVREKIQFINRLLLSKGYAIFFDYGDDNRIIMGKVNMNDMKALMSTYNYEGDYEAIPRINGKFLEENVEVKLQQVPQTPIVIEKHKKIIEKKARRNGKKN